VSLSRPSCYDMRGCEFDSRYKMCSAGSDWEINPMSDAQQNPSRRYVFLINLFGGKRLLREYVSSECP
jgi:hypothetical protein